MKIVLTGGPSAGKTTIAEIIARTFRKTFTLVPESASILFRGGFPRSTEGDGLMHQQVAIFHVQKQLELAIHAKQPQSHLICDRGTLDGLAYWQGEQEDFFKKVNSTFTQELGNYDWVIELDTANPLFYNSNSLRIETAEEAKLINQKIKNVWSHHPQHVLITNSTDFDKKIDRVLRVIHKIIAGEDIDQIRKSDS